MQFEVFMHCDVENMECKAKSCLYVYCPSSGYDFNILLFEEETGFDQKEQLGNGESFHL